MCAYHGIVTILRKGQTTKRSHLHFQMDQRHQMPFPPTNSYHQQQQQQQPNRMFSGIWNGNPSVNNNIFQWPSSPIIASAPSPAMPITTGPRSGQDQRNELKEARKVSFRFMHFSKVYFLLSY